MSLEEKRVVLYYGVPNVYSQSFESLGRHAQAYKDCQAHGGILLSVANCRELCSVHLGQVGSV